MAKKKLSVREQRELEKQKNAEAYRAKDAAKKEAQKAEQSAAQKRKEDEALRGFVDKVEAKRLIKRSPRVGATKVFKSKSSAVGVKSTFVIQNNVIHMTSAGPVHENKIEETRVTPLTDTLTYSAEVNGEQKKNHSIRVQNTKYPNLHTDISNPLYSSVDVGEDQIGLRPLLEKEFFGKTFPEDNVHIQIIYNILDIYKIVTVHSNNIVYSLNNLRRKNEVDGELDDLIADMSLDDKYEKILKARETDGRLYRIRTGVEKLSKMDQLAYFGTVFEPLCEKPAPKAPESEQKEYEKARFKHIYHVLALLGQFRQCCTHANAADSLFTLETNNNQKNREIQAILNGFYEKRVSELNEKFVQLNQKNNFNILFAAYDATTEEHKQKLVRDFYKFTVRKEHKNKGFSIKRLRECVLSLPEAEKYTAQEYDSVRAKLYQMMDFILQSFYAAHTERGAALVEELRTVVGEDPDKQKTTIYCREAIRIWSEVKDTVGRAAAGIDKVRSPQPLSDEEKKALERAQKEQERILNCALENDKIGTNARSFTKAMYLITQFLDGKEINDLLTNLASKLENISELLACASEMGLEMAFERKYAMFLDSANLAKEIRLVNSFARMAKPDKEKKTRLIMFQEAAELLGFDEKTDKKLLVAMLDKNNTHDKPREWITMKGGREVNTGFRNFIASNVIDSSRFRYIIRYGAPQYLRGIANNEAVIRFVLSDMPDNQIDRYYESCKLPAASTREAKVSGLARIITGIHFHDFKDVHQNPRKDEKKQQEAKARKQTVISLYLNVLYQLVKNLMYINARYVMALRALENDTYLWLKEIEDQDRAKNSRAVTCVLTERMIEWRRAEADKRWNRNAPLRHSQKCKQWHMLHPCKYLETDMGNTEQGMRQLFRNQVVHVAAIRNAYLYMSDLKNFDSYFSVYHYLVQRGIQATYGTICSNREKKNDYYFDLCEKTKTYFDMIDRYRSDCRDFTKALCAPFGYNLPRFKNLTIDALFDRNRPPKDEEDEE